MKKLMKVLPLSALLFSSAAFAAPELREKPVQCGTFTEVYNAYIGPNQLKPLFTGVATIMTHQGNKMAIPVVFYLNSDDGRWMWIETDNSETCVINIGDGFDPNVDEDELMNLLIPNTT